MSAGPIQKGEGAAAHAGARRVYFPETAEAELEAVQDAAAALVEKLAEAGDWPPSTRVIAAIAAAATAGKAAVPDLAREAASTIAVTVFLQLLEGEAPDIIEEAVNGLWLAHTRSGRAFMAANLKTRGEA